MNKLILPREKVRIISSSSVVGRDEAIGPLGELFDYKDESDKFGMDTWEKSESEMQRLAVSIALEKKNMNPTDIDIIFSGDLLNQCVGSNYGVGEFGIPYLGIYGACSTASEGMLLSAIFCSAVKGRSICSTSSHYCSAERQFRYPLEYGGQRCPTAQWTVTGSGAYILSSLDCDKTEGINVTVRELLPGKVVDMGINDINNMGAAMMPAAADTLLRYFSTGRTPGEFDMIITGDLGHEGTVLLRDYMEAEGYDIRNNHIDCGTVIYNADEQDKHSGGSGCGCSGAVMSTFIEKIRKGILNDILFVGTGALMSPLTLNQGSTIPGIAHLVRLTGEGG